MVSSWCPHMFSSQDINSAILGEIPLFDPPHNHDLHTSRDLKLWKVCVVFSCFDHLILKKGGRVNTGGALKPTGHEKTVISDAPELRTDSPPLI